MQSLVDSGVKLAVERLYSVPPHATAEFALNTRISLICIALDALVWVVLPLFVVRRVWAVLVSLFSGLGGVEKKVDTMGLMRGGNDESPTTCVAATADAGYINLGKFKKTPGRGNLKVSWNPKVQTFDDAVVRQPVAASQSIASASQSIASQSIASASQSIASQSIAAKTVTMQAADTKQVSGSRAAEKQEDLSSISNDSIDVDNVDLASKPKEYVLHRYAKHASCDIDLFELPSLQDSFVVPSTPASRLVHCARTPVQNTPYRAKLHANRLARKILDDLIDNAVWTSEMGGLVSPVLEDKVDALDVIADGEWDAMLAQPQPAPKPISRPTVHNHVASEANRVTSRAVEGGLQISELPPLPNVATAADFRTRLEALQRVKREQAMLSTRQTQSAYSRTELSTPSRKEMGVTTTDSGRRLYYQRTAHRDSGGGTRLSNLFEKALRK